MTNVVSAPSTSQNGTQAHRRRGRRTRSPPQGWPGQFEPVCVVVDFDGHKKRTSTVCRNLNPEWNEYLEFEVTDPKTMDYEELEIEVFNDKRMSNGNARKNHFLGRVKLYGSQFKKKGDEGLIYFQLEKKSVFSWIRGELGLKIFYSDELVEEQKNKDDLPPEKEQPHPYAAAAIIGEDGKVLEVPVPTAVAMEVSQLPPVVIKEEAPSVVMVQPEHNRHHYYHQQVPPLVKPEQPPPEVRKMQIGRNGENERVRVYRRSNGDFSPKVISANESPYVKIRTSSHFVMSKPAIHRSGDTPANREWHQVFALAHNKPETANSTLEISVWDLQSEHFLGGVCFDLSDVPVRDPPDSPLAPQWYRLEGGGDSPHSVAVSGDLQLSVWIGTQADDAFPESWSSDAPYVAHTRSKVYQSPKLWYLRVTVIEAQDLHIAPNLPPLTAPEIRVKAQLGFQSLRTRRAGTNSQTTSFFWHEDIVFVAGEPLEDNLILLVEDRTVKDPTLLGHVMIPVASIDQRLDERHVASKWFGLDGGGGGWALLWSDPPEAVLGGRLSCAGRGRARVQRLPADGEAAVEAGSRNIRARNPWGSRVAPNEIQGRRKRKMGEIEVAVRFACPSLLPDTCAVYGQRLLPKMHYLRPFGVAQQEALRGAATKMVAAWLARSEPPLGPEHGQFGLAKWLDEVRRWRNPVTTILVHLLYLVLVWYPDLVVPTGFLYVVLIGVWYYRFKPKIPAGMDTRLSQAETVDSDELDEEFDPIPSSKPHEVIRVRYDRLRTLAARVQTVLGDVATQGERVQALVSWRDPRATKLFIGVCLAITVILYVVPAKMVAVALGFYFLRHPMFRDPMPPPSLNFFRRLPSLSDRLM
ncbi:C2 calcium/lipid-binding plant phosphoribosyltransferase family protein [Actinidia rufa]|uniref:C2 calcium/lipid-binding plant phosphoribosyltransferase family protein n=1 Tax=Actinidia rufa TaxID=165716 RepID=A0A7J0GMP0_9ERIC|nr:C2 calcium/lipid-binding plant phosphoribosyltransferase family protein [Actinidia rufa]